MTIGALLSRGSGTGFLTSARAFHPSFHTVVRSKERGFMFSLYRLAKERSIPGRSVRVPWSLQLFRTQSTNSSAWMAPFRNAALESYKEVLEAVAA